MTTCTAEKQNRILQTAFDAYAAGKLPAALVMLESLLKHNPSNMDALMGAGMVKFQWGQKHEALKYFERGLDTSPEHRECALNAAGICININELAKANTIISSALHFHPHCNELLQLDTMVTDLLTIQSIPLQVISLYDISRGTATTQKQDGDYWFSHHLKLALAAKGVVVNRDEPRAALWLHGVTPRRLRDDLYNMLWIHSHPDQLTRQQLMTFDKVYSLSHSFVNKLSAIGIDAEPLVGGTACCAPQNQKECENKIIFVGNARQVNGVPCSRPVIEAIKSIGDPWISKLNIWGLNWEGLVPQECIKGDVYPNDQLADLYHSALAVLNDHHEDMRTNGFINPRILDVMASEGLVISDDIKGIEPRIQNAVLTYRSPRELEDHLNHIADDPEFRMRQIQKGRNAAKKFTFQYVADHIVAHMLSIDRNALADRKKRFRPRGPLEGYEADITYDGNTVVKKFKPIYFEYNDQYGRKGEYYWLNRCRSSFFPEIISHTAEELVTKNAGTPIGAKDVHVPGKTQWYPGLNLLKCISWLQDLKTELHRLGVKHRDINPYNILYDEAQDTFTLIDLSWMIGDTEPDGPTTHPPNLNPYASTDTEAIDQLCIDCVHRLISKINQTKHYDGSSTLTGWVYHPIPFKEFAANVHKTAAIGEWQEIQDYCQLKTKPPLHILEIGSSVGYFSFHVAQLGHTITAYEADPQVYEVAEALRIIKHFDNIQFIQEALSSESLANTHAAYDITLMLNVHMWIHKQCGDEKTKLLMRTLSQKTKHLLFQTAHAESGGMYRIDGLRDKNDIAAYLRECGFKNIRHIRDTQAHGGTRCLFACDGHNETAHRASLNQTKKTCV